jgi:hypothetical protein
MRNSIDNAPNNNGHGNNGKEAHIANVGVLGPLLRQAVPPLRKAVENYLDRPEPPTEPRLPVSYKVVKFDPNSSKITVTPFQNNQEISVHSYEVYITKNGKPVTFLSEDNMKTINKKLGENLSKGKKERPIDLKT